MADIFCKDVKRLRVNRSLSKMKNWLSKSFKLHNMHLFIDDTEKLSVPMPALHGDCCSSANQHRRHHSVLGSASALFPRKPGWFENKHQKASIRQRASHYCNAVVVCETVLLLSGPLLGIGWGTQHEVGQFSSVWEHLFFRHQSAVTHAAVYDDRRPRTAAIMTFGACLYAMRRCTRLPRTVAHFSWTDAMYGPKNVPRLNWTGLFWAVTAPETGPVRSQQCTLNTVRCFCVITVMITKPTDYILFSKSRNNLHLMLPSLENYKSEGIKSALFYIRSCLCTIDRL